METHFSSSQKMPAPYTIGVAGHVDHGKTTLVRTLTGVDTDRRPEEKLRGMSIDAGVAPLLLPSGKNVAIVDVPGHIDFLKNTIRGLNSVDMGILVVAADDGVMPQTREHLEILKFFRVASGFVVLSKTDLVDEETLEMAELEIKELVQGTFLEQHPILTFTAKIPTSVSQITKSIDEILLQLSSKKTDSPFRLWIDQIKSFPGHGTVVSGTVASGIVRQDDALEILPSGIQSRARSLESHASPVPQAVAGQRVGINLHRVSLESVRRGMSLTTPETLSPHSILNAEIQIVSDARTKIQNRQKVKLYLGTSITSAMVVPMEKDRLDPGEAGLVQLQLAKPIAALPQDVFVISPLNSNRVIAGGRVLEASKEKYRAAKSRTLLPALDALRKNDLIAYIQHLSERHPGDLVTAKGLALKTGLPRDAFEKQINANVRQGEWIYFKGHGAIEKAHWSALKREFKSAVEAAFKEDPLKKNVSMKEVAKTIPFCVENPLLKILADSLCKEGDLESLEGGFCLPASRIRFDSHRESLISLLLEFAQSSGTTPFSADTFWKHYQKRFDKEDISRLLNHLFARKKLVRLNDDRFLSLKAMDQIKKAVRQTIAQRGFVTVHDCKELFGYGRWGGTHVLDYLNQTGFTLRRQDKHYLVTEP
ncbi:MAG: selenocysteine-specific translation elongation factor [Desulfobacterales bacterium CG07_land_8_20_14_0_80_52_14]|nr:MAG: selenocysteine-specific translation elongation factor [Desulfobacterales bacterium CG23_combo_of_CG06-09_8_20_14_all_52_9]PIU50671.1 MAG: selenocysteine-specific translation elongation factor [Desulfobacterales bacterium CG07_land_8_20_14_0_80_52_14]